MNKKTLRKIKNMFFVFFKTRNFKRKCVKKFAKTIKNKKILEIGSGEIYKGVEYYSLKEFFDSSNEFIQSDIIPEYNHKVIDVTKMNYKNKFDVILCTGVLEHVYDIHKSIQNMHKALKPNGILILYIPFLYPLHGEPNDYWRFTRHSIRKLLKEFRIVKIRHFGIKYFPFMYYVESIK